MRQSCDLGFTSEEVGVHIMTEKGSPGAGQGSETHIAQADARDPSFQTWERENQMRRRQKKALRVPRGQGECPRS